MDENGRIVIPPRIRERAQITSKAMFVGMGDKFQIWEPDSYRNDMMVIDQRLSENNFEDEIYALLDYNESTSEKT